MRTTLALTASLFLALPALAGPGGPPAGGPGQGAGPGGGQREEMRARVQQKVRTYLAVELSSRLALDTTKSQKLADAIQAHMERRRTEREGLRTEAQKLRELVDKKAPDAQVKAQLDVLVKKHARGDNFEALLADTGKFLTVQEQAKLALSLPEVMKGMREMMKDARREMRGGRRGGGGGGPGGPGGFGDDDGF
jgi:hypothetical protein